VMRKMKTMKMRFREKIISSCSIRTPTRIHRLSPTQKPWINTDSIYSRSCRRVRIKSHSIQMWER
jgi:hypothetical protein